VITSDATKMVEILTGGAAGAEGAGDATGADTCPAPMALN
jgi:hypothetical protein